MNRNFCVIDSNGFYKTLVTQCTDINPITGKEESFIVGYNLKDGECLVDSSVPQSKVFSNSPGFVKPKWVENKWIEGATNEEISEWNNSHPAPETPKQEPTIDERVSDLEEQLVQADETAIALYESQQEQETINAQQDEALMEIYEMLG